MAILLTSKTFREFATYIFFSSNHFVVMSMNENLSCDTPFGLYQFLTNVSESGRQSLRSITLLTTALAMPKWLVGHPGGQGPQWRQAIDILSSKRNLSQLTITIDTSFPRQWFDKDESYPTVSMLTARQKEELDVAWLMSYDLKFRGWKDVFFHLSWRSKKDPTTDDEYLNDGSEPDEEEKLEKAVMGESYDSMSRGKLSRSHVWNGYDCECEDCEDCDGIPAVLMPDSKLWGYGVMNTAE